MTHHTNNDKTAVVSDEYYWQPIDSKTPLGVKLQLCSKKYGVATYGSLSTKETYFTHWAPLPKVRKQTEENI